MLAALAVVLAVAQAALVDLLDPLVVVQGGNAGPGGAGGSLAER